MEIPTVFISYKLQSLPPIFIRRNPVKPVKQFTEIARTGKSTGISHIGHRHRRVSKHSTSLFKAIVVQVLHGRYGRISLEKGCALCFAAVSCARDVFEQQLARIILLDESNHGSE